MSIYGNVITKLQHLRVSIDRLIMMFLFVYFIAV